MARIGLKSAKYNKITANDKYDAVTSGVPALQRIIEEKFAPEYASGELYADDVLADFDRQFIKGTLALTVADDDEAIVSKLMGATYTAPAQSTTEKMVCNISDSIIEIGYGHVVPCIKQGVKSWKVEFFPRAKATKVTSDGKTKGANGIEYNTCTIELLVLPCDRAINGHAVGEYRVVENYSTESAAITGLDTLLTPTV